MHESNEISFVLFLYIENLLCYGEQTKSLYLSYLGS